MTLPGCPYCSEVADDPSTHKCPPPEFPAWKEGLKDRGPGRPRIGDPVLVRLTPQLRSLLNAEAERQEVSLAEVIRRTLTEALTAP